MSRQLSIDSFFNKSKSFSQSVREMPDESKRLKRTTLTLKSEGTPPKTPKVNQQSTQVIQEVISLDSDDENRDIFATSPNQWDTQLEVLPTSSEASEDILANEDILESSGSTVLYSLTPETAQAKANEQHTPSKRTEKILGESPSILQNLQSPSKRKFFSPNKKRMVTLRPNKVKRNLSSEMERSNVTTNRTEDDKFNQACEGMDDITITLLTIIIRYIKDDSVRHLLDRTSQTLLENCLRVVKPGMRLVCRLYWRKEGWRKVDKIRKIISNEGAMDDSILYSALASLEENGLIEKGDTKNMGVDDFNAILTKDELKQICKELKIKIQSKQDAMAALLSFSRRKSNISNYLHGQTSNNLSRVLQFMSTKAGPCYRLTALARSTLYRLHVLMYLGMDYSVIREKKLEFVVLYDKIKRETYPIDNDMVLDSASVVFRSKDEFERYMSAHIINEDFLAMTDVNEKCNIVKQVYDLYKEINEDEMRSYKAQPSWLRRYTPAHIYARILEAGVQELKRNKTDAHYTLAVDILSSLIEQTAFRQHRKAGWFAEMALILHNCLGRYDEAAELLLEGFRLPMSEEAKDSMRPRSHKIATQKNTSLSEHLRAALLDHATKDTILENNLESKHIHKQPMDRVGQRGKVKFEKRASDGRTVMDAEEYCIAQYLLSEQFTHGEHWEGRIVTTIFFLLFWEIIYTKPGGIPGIFLSHYQKFPLDLFTEDFYKNRKAAIDIWLEVIETGPMEKVLGMMHETWLKRPEQELSGVSRAIGWDNVRAVASCLQPRGLACLCRRLATNYRYAHSGFPDLTLWNVNTGHIKFVEVKTDSDKPSMKQIQWMYYLKENGIDTGFCYVGVHTTRQRSRTGAKPKAATPRKRKERVKKVKKEGKKKAKVKVESLVASDSENEFVVKTEGNAENEVTAKSFEAEVNEL